MALETVKFSTVFVAMSGRTKVYAALDEVPVETRRKLMEATTGQNSATILIADRAGREQILRALRGLPSQVQARLVSSKFPWTQAFERRALPRPESRPAVRRRVSAPAITGWLQRHWLEIAAPCAVAVALWVLLNLY